MSDQQRELNDLQADIAAEIAVLAAGLTSLPVADEPGLRGSIRKLNQLLLKAQSWLVSNTLRTANDADADPAPTGPLLQAELGRFRAALNRWPLIRDLIERQLEARAQRLSSPEPKPYSRNWVQNRLTDDLFNALHMALTPALQDAAANDAGAYADIGLHNSVFVQLMLAARRVRLAQGARRTCFLDVGCGVGVKVLGAFRFFEESAGLELDPGYLTAARKLLDGVGLGRAELIRADALHFADYDRFDVIYFFKPLRDEPKLRALETIITGRVSPDTLLLAPYRGFEARHRSYGCHRLANGVYLAGGSRAAALQLRQRAEWIGLAPLVKGESLPDFWQPVLETSQANGYDLFRPGRLDGV